MVTQPYLNLLVEPRIFFRFSGKNIILWMLKGKMPFNMRKIYLFPEKKIVCLPYLNFSDPLPETHLLYNWALLHAFLLYADFLQNQLFQKILSRILL